MWESGITDLGKLSVILHKNKELDKIDTDKLRKNLILGIRIDQPEYQPTYKIIGVKEKNRNQVGSGYQPKPDIYWRPGINRS